MYKKGRYIFLLFLFLSVVLFSQQILVFDIFKISGCKRIRFHVGDPITLKLIGEVNKRSGKIEAFGDTSLFVSGREIVFDSVRYVYIDRTNLLTGVFARFLLYAGLGYVAIDALNGLKLGGATLVSPRVMLVGLPMVAVGWFLHENRIRRYRVGENRVLKLIDITM